MAETMRGYWDRAATQDPAGYSATGFHDLGAPFLASGERDAWDVTRRLGVRIEHAGRLLEIGAGAGRTTATFARYADSVVAADVSPVMLDHARAALRDAANASFVTLRGDGTLPFDDASFDVVFSQYTLMHIPSAAMQVRYVGEAGRVLDVGGVALLQIGRSDLRNRVVDLGSQIYHRLQGRRTLAGPWRGARPGVRALHDAPDRGVRVSVLNLEDRFLWLVLRRTEAIS